MKLTRDNKGMILQLGINYGGRDEIRRLLPEREQDVERLMRSHAEPQEGYRLRQVVAYGVAECIRSAMVEDLLNRGDLAGFA